MGRIHPRETIAAALREYHVGVRVPMVCQHFGISERTFYRWIRAEEAAVALEPEAQPPAGGPPAEGGCCEVLRVIVASLDDPERERATRLVESRLRLTRELAARLLGLERA